MEAYLSLGPATSKPQLFGIKTKVTSLPAGLATEIVISGLQPSTEYAYRLFYRSIGAANFTQRAERRFATQRSPGSTFVFTVQGDSHPERPQSSNPDLYARTLQAAAADRPDLHICIGDDFSVEKLATVPVASVTPAVLAGPYLLQRPFLGLIGQNATVFLMNGNVGGGGQGKGGEGANL